MSAEGELPVGEVASFLEQVRAHFLIPEKSPIDQRLDSLGFDSLRTLELVSFVEDMAGLPPGESPDAYPILESVSDAVDYYSELVCVKRDLAPVTSDSSGGIHGL